MNCPACDTELTKARGRRQGTSYWWCWKCERALRLGEVRQAREASTASPSSGGEAVAPNPAPSVAGVSQERRQR